MESSYQGRGEGTVGSPSSRERKCKFCSCELITASFGVYPCDCRKETSVSTESIMKVGIYSVRDLKADAFMQVWNAPTDGVAARNFAQGVNEAQSPFAKNPEDFALYKLASFDESTGEIVGHLPAQICTAISCVK